MASSLNLKISGTENLPFPFDSCPAAKDFQW